MENKRKYSYYTYNNNGIIVTVCVTNYKGHLIRATAKCMPDDEFDEAIGKEISKRRVDVKIAKKKMKNVVETANAIHKVINTLSIDLEELMQKSDELRDFINANNEY